LAWGIIFLFAPANYTHPLGLGVTGFTNHQPLEGLNIRVITGDAFQHYLRAPTHIKHY